MKTYPHGRPPIHDLGSLRDASGKWWGFAYEEGGDVWCMASLPELFGRTVEQCFFRVDSAGEAVEEASKLAKRQLSLVVDGCTPHGEKAEAA